MGRPAKYASPEEKREAARARAKAWYHANKERARAKKAEWVEANKDTIRTKHQVYYRQNADAIRARSAKRYEGHKEQWAEYGRRRREKPESKEWHRAYRTRNRDALNAKRKAWLASSPSRLMATRMRGRLNVALRRQQAGRVYSTFALVGCTPDDLKVHLEKQFQPGMTWENYGRRGWHVDHIKPCISFDLTDPEQQKACFHYTNLQPLWWHQNLSKGGR